MKHWRKAWTFKRRDRSGWWVGWLEDGRIRKRRYPSQADAERAKRFTERQLNQWLLPPGSRAWGDIMEEYVVRLAAMSPRHQDAVGRLLEAFGQAIEPKTGDAVTPANCERFLFRRKAALATIAKEHRQLSAFFSWAVQRGHCPANPMNSVHKPRPPRRLIRPPTEREWVRMLEVLSEIPDIDAQAWHVLILLAVVTGLRQATLLAIRVGDIILGTQNEQDIGLLSAYTPKTRKETLFGLPPCVNERLAIRIGSIPAGCTGLLPWHRWQRKQWGRIQAAAGTCFTFHSLRAASATRAAVARAEQAAQYQLDHSSASVTRDHYLSQAAVARAVAAQIVLPELPPLPPYREATGRARQRGSASDHRADTE